MIRPTLLTCLVTAGAACCTRPACADPPAWSADAVWYQVFVSRFCNGEPANDPPGTLPWTTDWAQLLPDEQPPLHVRLYHRGYGGDLQGLTSRLDYLASLGVNALYLNPVFAAKSQHKYDTADHRHIDPAFALADEPAGLASETADPATWVWTPSDRYFRDFLAEAHRRGMRVVLDGVFNHVGREFWAFRDVVARGADSPYARWFDVTEWGPPLRYQAWDGPNGQLPRFRREGDGLDPQVEAYLFAVVRRWLDPDGDGDPSDGIDGWRLDAAEQVPHGFWRRFRTEVRKVNPAALILGEIWIDPAPWMGDQFDCVTDYRFLNAVVEFLREGSQPAGATRLADRLLRLHGEYPRATAAAMVDLLDSHDTERVVTMLAEPGLRARTERGDIVARDLLAPTEEDYHRQVLGAVMQFTWVGAPMIYYGDELGMSGGDDPFCRAPMRWDRVEQAQFAQLMKLYGELGRLRRERVELRRGGCRVLWADDARRVFAYERFHQQHRTRVVIHAGSEALPNPLAGPLAENSRVLRGAWGKWGEGQGAAAGRVQILEPLSALIETSDGEDRLGTLEN